MSLSPAEREKVNRLPNAKTRPGRDPDKLRSERKLSGLVLIWAGGAALAGWIFARRLARRRPPPRPTGPAVRPPGHAGKKGRTIATRTIPQKEFTISALLFELLTAAAATALRQYLASWRTVWQRRHDLLTAAAPIQAAGKPPPPATEPAAIPGDDPKTAMAGQSPPLSLVGGAVFLFKQSGIQWVQDKCPQLGAALAYFTVFSLAPLVLVLLAVFGLVFGSSEQARQHITEQLRYLIDPSGVRVIEDIATNASQPKHGFLASALGVIIALFGASGVFGQLQSALNTIWGVKPKPGNSILTFLRQRFLSFAMVGGVCFLLLVSLTVEGVLHSINQYIESFLPSGHLLALTVFFIFDLSIIVLLFAMIFRYLPDAKIAWRDVWIGAAMTALLFGLGKFLLGLYLGSGAAGSAYGAASSMITLLLWVGYSAQILLFGAEFTQVYANSYGSQVEPVEHATKVERREVEVPTAS